MLVLFLHDYKEIEKIIYKKSLFLWFWKRSDLLSSHLWWLFRKFSECSCLIWPNHLSVYLFYFVLPMFFLLYCLPLWISRRFFWISRNAVAWFGPTSLFTAVADNHKKLARPSESPTNSPRSWLTRFLFSQSMLASLKVCSLPLRNKVHRTLSTFMKIFTPAQLSCNSPLFWFWRKN